MSNFRRSTIMFIAATLTAMIAVFAAASPAQAASYGPFPAKVDIDGRGSMDPYDRIKTDAYLAGQDVHIQCQDWGMSAGGSTLWDFTVGNYWIPDAYITTGTDGRVSGVPLCSSLGIDGTPSGVGFSAGPYPASVAVDGRGSMDPDDRIKTDAYLAGEAVYIKCQDYGLSAGGSTVWIYTTDGYWIPDAYVSTGSTGFVDGAPRCLSIGVNGTPSSGGANSGPYPVKFAVDGRGSPDPDDRIRTDAYPDGSSLRVRCQDYGVSTGGSTLWIYTTDGYWVPDAYVTTGTDGRLAGVPLCSSIGVDGGTGSVGDGQQFKVRTTLNGYYEKSLSSGNVWDKYPEGSYVTLMCQAYGEVNYGGNTVWGFTSDGLWVPDYYVITGSDGIVMDRCDNDGPSGGGNNFLVKTTLNGYHEKSLDSDNVWDKYAGGSYVTITCQAYGEYNYGGSAVWDYTSDGLWVPDYYIYTGSTGIVMDRCDDDPPPSGGPGNPTVPATPAPGSVESSNVRSAIVNAAYSQLGTHEWGDNCNPYRFKESAACGQPWCSYFASWTWAQAGIDVYFPYSGTFETWGKNRGLLRSKSDIRPGDVVLYGTSYYDSNHVGVVVDVAPNGHITTIEGNYKNQVIKVGPFDPNRPSTTGHTKKNIYAVVAPTADPTTSANWSTLSNSDYDDENDGVDSGEEMCDSGGALGTVAYMGCLAYSAGGTSVRPRVHVLVPDGDSPVIRAKITIIDADGDLHITMCEAAVLAKDRTCDSTTGYLSTTGGVVRARADVEVNGNWRPAMHLASLPVDGEEQVGQTWCGVAATRATLQALQHSPLLSQAQYADMLGTSDDWGSFPWNVRDVLNEELAPSGRDDYVYHDYAAEGVSSDKWQLVRNKIRTSVDMGYPVPVVVQIRDIPWWDSDANQLYMHYLVVTGYAGTQTSSGFEVGSFTLWDPARDEHYFATSSQLYSMTNMDAVPDQGHMIVVAE